MNYPGVDILFALNRLLLIGLCSFEMNTYLSGLFNNIAIAKLKVNKLLLEQTCYNRPFIIIPTQQGATYMGMVSFVADGNRREGYLALPESGQGKGILVLHAWWGLTDFFKSLCDQLAAEGFVAFAPDLHHGKTASTAEEATQILERRDFPATQATAEAGLHFLQNHSAITGEKLSGIGFSMGAAFALLLDSVSPGSFDKIVLFYGGSGADLSQSKSQFQCHYGENDDWEPMDNVRQMQSSNAEIYTYPGAGHWFFETDQVDHFDADAAALAWNRALEFLRMQS